MRLTSPSRIIGAVAAALVVAALAPGVSVGYRLTHQEAARLAQLSGRHSDSASQATVVRPNPDEQTTQASGTTGYVTRVHGAAPGAPAVRAPSDTFDYGDAAVGAIAAAAIVLLAAAAVVRRRSQVQRG
jgi:hypothetical protein